MGARSQRRRPASEALDLGDLAEPSTSASHLRDVTVWSTFSLDRDMEGPSVLVGQVCPDRVDVLIPTHHSRWLNRIPNQVRT